MNVENNIAVSICCLTYNHAPFLQSALDGFVTQKTRFPFEVVIHDDASTDQTSSLIRDYQEKYPDIIRPIFQKENQFSKQGVYPCGYLYPAALGRYIAECEGDDYWTDPHKLQTQYDYMEAHPECSICYHDFIVYDVKDGKFTSGNDVPGHNYSKADLIRYRQPHQYEIHPSTKFMKNIFLQHPENNVLHGLLWGDYPTTIMMGMYGEGHYVPNITPSVYRRRHAASSWCNLPAQEMSRLTQEMHARIYKAMLMTKNDEWAACRRRFC